MATRCAGLRYETAPAIKKSLQNINYNLGPTVGDKASAVAKFAIAAITINAGMYALPVPNLFASATQIILMYGIGSTLGQAPSCGRGCSEGSRHAPPMIDNFGRYYGKTHLLALGNGALFGLFTGTVMQLILRYRAGALFSGVRNGFRTVGQSIRVLALFGMGKFMWDSKVSIRHRPPVDTDVDPTESD